MKNKYKIVGDTLIVYNRKDNREILFDTEDFALISKHTWCIHHSGYAITNVYVGNNKKKQQSAHRLIMGNPENMLVDHINSKNTLDNRKINLRIATYQINNHNRHAAKGYYWNTQNNKWQAYIRTNKKTIHLGSYDIEAEARTAYLEAKKIYHPTAPIDLYK